MPDPGKAAAGIGGQGWDQYRVGKGLGAGPGQSRGASSSTHLRNGRYPATFREGELQ